jgi:hypothetical protein
MTKNQILYFTVAKQIHLFFLTISALFFCLDFHKERLIIRRSLEHLTLQNKTFFINLFEVFLGPFLPCWFLTNSGSGFMTLSSDEIIGYDVYQNNLEKSFD